MRLVEECLRVVESQPSLLRLRVPIKIFGSVYGRFSELLRFFENYGCPTDDELWGGDVERFDYLFLGNYVNRGFNSLETICALFALKVRYPD
jgi:protein phosphatase